MFWQEDDDKSLAYVVPNEVLDISFAIHCKRLPVDHAWVLSQAIQTALPWFSAEPLAGIHTIHVADSGNGWERPTATQWLLPSRRTRLLLRIPQQRFTAVQALTGQTLMLADTPLIVGASKIKPFTPAAVLFARYVLSTTDESEPAFLQRMAAEIKQVADFKIKKMLCGKTYTLNTPQGALCTRHLMLADIDQETSICLQQQGLGGGQQLGCGLFLPHKSIQTLNPDT